MTKQDNRDTAHERLIHINRILLAIRNVSQLIVSEDDPRRLIERACVNLTETMGYHSAWIALRGGEAARALGLPGQGPVSAAAAAGYDGGFELMREKLDRGAFPDCMTRAMESEDALVVGDPAVDCSDCPLRGEYDGRAGLVRRMEFDGVIYGILVASVPAAYANDVEEQNLFSEVVGDLAFALHKIATALRHEQSQQRMCLLIEGSGLGTWEWNVQTNETVFNEQWASMLGYTIEEVTPYDYATWERLVHPDNLVNARDAQLDCIEGRTPEYSCEFRMKHKDGHWVWILDRGRVMTRDAEGKALAMFGTHTDITDRKQAEEKLEREHAMLARTEAVAHVGSWEWDAEGDKTIWSDELFRIFGLEPAEEAPPFAEQLGIYAPQDYVRLAQAVEECMKNGVPYKMDLHIVRADGERRHCFVRGFPERDADGVVKRLYGSLEDITERKLVESMFRESEQKWRSILVNTPQVGITLDTQANIVFANKHFLELTGWREDEVIGRNWFDFFIPEDVRETVQDIFHTVMIAKTTTGPLSYENEIVLKSGQKRTIAWSNVISKNANGDIVDVTCLGIDLTERRVAEDRLKSSYDLLNNLSALVPGVIYQYRLFPDGRSCLPYSSYGIRKIYEVTPEEVEKDAATVFSRLHPEDVDRVSEAIFESARTQETFKCEFRAVLPEQGLRWHRSHAEPQRMEDGGTLWHGIILDITESKKAEEALKASETRFKELLQNVTTVAVQGYALDGTVRYWNRASEALYGYTAEEALGKNLLDLIIPPDFHEDVREAMRRMAETGETIPTSELLLMRKDRSLVPVYSSHAQVQLPGQKPELFCIDIDLTLLKQAEAERETLQTQLTQSQKMESVGRLAGGVAHDFNNMLNVILGHVELALYDLPADSPLRDNLDEVRKAAERSANLTRQLLAFARKQTVAPKILDLNETIASMLKMLERLIGEDIDLLWKPGARLNLIRIDPGQMDQVLANLTVNARDAIGHANGKVTIETGNARFDDEYCADHAGFKPGDYVMLAVSDDGCGMDEETCTQIFEPFFTTKGVGEGTGLGLATIYGIVRQNNGFVNVYSELGKGSSFRIYLPALESVPSHHENARFSEKPSVGGTETILIVEDEPGILDLTRTMLERKGYSVLAASTPSEAIGLAQERENEIKLVVSDVVMPEMNGRDLIKKLQEYCPQIRSLFMSGYTADVIAHQGVLDEGVNFIQKPFSAHDLAAQVREAMDS